MPPRLRSSNLPSSTFTSCPSIRSQTITRSARTCREFSQTSCRQVTLRRRKFYEWLNGPGKALKQPLPGSTNYLGAYDKYGNLVRARPGWQRDGPVDKQKIKEQEAEKDGAAEKKDGDEAMEGQENIAELEASAREEEKKRKDGQSDSELPPEAEEDLRPFPVNPYFRSQPVLSEELREAIYQRVKRDGATVSLASVEFGVSNERVGAVVRLKQMEKEWVAQGITLAIPYAKAVLGMLPTTPYIDPSLPGNKNKRPIRHEPINDLPVHPATRQQLFVPVAESRHFTREDAGKAFDNNLLPADDRIPHPELILAERELNAGLSFEERKKLAANRFAKEEEKRKQLEEKKREELRSLKVVPKRRWDFVFKDISVDSAGRDGKDPRGVGWRYGFPHEDRKKGMIKIPTKVEA